ncbi:hypothetical protein Q2941_04730 [Bradyrhizobium sp. UFLA05-153]
MKPPSNLSPAERAAFLDIVNNTAPTHFQMSDLPLLCRYAEAIVLAERAAKELRGNAVVNGKASPWLVVQEKSLRAIVALSMRLRLSPQGRRPNNPPPKLTTPASYYDTFVDDEDDE